MTVPSVSIDDATRIHRSRHILGGFSLLVSLVLTIANFLGPDSQLKPMVFGAFGFAAFGVVYLFAAKEETKHDADLRHVAKVVLGFCCCFMLLLFALKILFSPNG